MKQKIKHAPLVILNNLGETSIKVAISGFKNFIQFLVLTLKLIWEKTVKIRTKVINIAKYLFVFVASPFVKMWINLHNMKQDMSKQKQDKGLLWAIAAFLPYLARGIFGKRGVAVTAFNYTAPILSFIFLFNVVSYATSTNFTLRLTVNGEFLGYIGNEQVFLDAEAFVLQRVNYFGSDKTIEITPEFSIANVGESDTLTMNQVADLILQGANFNLSRAYGFFIDDELYGAILEKDYHLIEETIASLFSVYARGTPDEEAVFLRNVVWDKYDLYLEESVVDPQKIITMITATNADGEPFLPVMVTTTEEYDADVPFETIYRNDDTVNEGSTKVTQQGKSGISRVVARVSYENGVEARRNIIQSTPISEPVAKIIHLGTKPPATGVTATQESHQGMFIWPVVNASGDPMGNISPGQHFRSGHSGIDIVGSNLYGTPVVAGGDGVVVTVSYIATGYGYHVVIQHENGLKTLYAHNSELHVVEGQYVTQGDQIASLGSTGASTGAHVHFEVIEGHRRINPMDYVYLP